MDEKESTRELVVVDIKRYKKVKKALHESEERYRQLFENVPIGIYRSTREGRIMDANPAMLKMLGYEYFDELSSRNLEKDYFDADYPRSHYVAMLEQNGEIMGLEMVWHRKDGSLIHVRENAKLIQGEGGLVFFEGTVEDISQSKLAEEAQRVRIQQIEILNCIISKGNMAESLQEMLEVILDCVNELLGFDAVAIFLYDIETKKMNLAAARGTKKNLRWHKKYMSAENMSFANVLHGEPVFVDNARENLPDLARQWGWRMASSIPLVSKGRVIGALNAASSRRDAFRPEEKNILELIGKEAGTLISKLQTETALRESEKYYRTLIDTSPDIIFVLDFRGTMVMVNQRFLQLSGYFYDEVVGHNVLEFAQGVDPAAFQAGIKKFLKAGKIDQLEYPIKKKDGTFFSMELALSSLSDEQGAPSSLMGVGHDISERKKAEQELRESKALLDAVVENVPLMIFLKEATDLRFVIFNRAGKELLSYGCNSLIGKNDLDLFPAEQAAFFMAKDREVLSGAAGMLDIPVEPIMTAKKGQRLLHTRKVCIRGADGETKYLLGISEDITERKEAEAKLLAYQEQLRALTSEMVLVEERERRRIASELHDQIGQNLALCKLKVAALENHPGHDDLKNELTMVRRLLEVSIQDARSLIFDLSPPVLYELGLAAALEWLAERMQEQFHIPVEFESRSQVPELQNDRQVILFQVVRELLINVGKHSRARQAKLILSQAGALLKIQVNDDGAGFDASKVFAPREQSSGFGFFSIRERLNYVGGMLDIKSKPGQGSQIVLTVPLPDGGNAAAKENS